MPNDNTTQPSATWNSNDTWSVSNPLGSYGAAVTRAGDVFYGTQVLHSNQGGPTYFLDNTYTTSDGYVDNGVNNGPVYFAYIARESTYQANYFGAIVDQTSPVNNYFFGSGAVVSDIDRGAKAYATVNTWRGWDGDAYDGGYNFTYYIGSASAQNISGNAIHISGAATFEGDNQINGSVVAGGVYVRGSNVNFNGSVTAPIYFSSAGAANINGGGDVVGTVNFQGRDATLTLSNGSNITGSVVNSATNNGTLNFEGSSVVTGAVGTINAVNVTGDTSRVQLNTVSGDTTVNTLTISADKAVVEVGGKLTGNVNMGGHTSKLELNDRGGVGKWVS